MAGVMKVEKNGLDGAVVRNILADSSQRDDMAGCVRGAEGLPDLTRRLIVHFAGLAGEVESRGAQGG